MVVKCKAARYRYSISILPLPSQFLAALPGAVKVTPAHDPVDFEAGKRHNLPTLQVIDDRGNLTANCGTYAGLPRFRARSVVLDELARYGLLRGSRDYPMAVPICSRSKDVVEYLVRPQWFVNCQRMAEEALEDVRSGRLTIVPAQFEKNWFHWLENIRYVRYSEIKTELKMLYLFVSLHKIAEI